MKPKMVADKMDNGELMIIPLWLDLSGDIVYKDLLVFKSELPDDEIMYMLCEIEKKVKKDDEWGIDMIIERFYDRVEIQKVEWDRPSEYEEGIVI